MSGASTGVDVFSPKIDLVSQGAAIAITCDKNATVYDKRITLVRIH